MNHWNEFDMVKFNQDLSPCPCGFHHSFQHNFQDVCTCKQMPHRLTPLQFGLAQRLRLLIDCEVLVEFLSGEEDEQIEGTLCLVGTNFIEVCVEADKKAKQKETVFIIPLNAIKFIKKIGG